ncbi:MAG TPA: hypothetical protein PKD99_17800 [Sphingopyxis sp.]|nr:hypothetical protein [Sphingopyxis sp.]HMP46955.1 hypothetical protein [Sphingopyxis sp.]HMQ19241.1 hypothetical protein [Sphingopyxis sp.]
MRMLLLAALFALSPAAQAHPPAGAYRLAEGPDAAGMLVIAPDGGYEYGLAVGALDEYSQGRWEARGDAVCLITDPKPVPPVFEKAEPLAVEGAVPTLLVTWPDGDAISGIDFVIGFDEGDSVAGYTQYNGWTMPDDDPRTPRWIEVSEPVYDIGAPRFELGEGDAGRLHLRLIPNDLGRVDLTDACFAAQGDRFVLRRREGEMRFVWVGDEE